MKNNLNLIKIIKHPLTKIAVVVSIVGTGTSLLISTYSFFFTPPEKEREEETQKKQDFESMKSTLIDTLYTLHPSAYDFVKSCESKSTSNSTNRTDLINKANAVNNLVNKVLSLKSDAQEMPQSVDLAVRAYLTNVDKAAEYTIANGSCPSPLISSEDLQKQINITVNEIQSSQESN